MACEDDFDGGLPVRPAPDPALVDLRILATSDVHGWLKAWDYHAARPLAEAGLTRTASLIGQARSLSANTLLFDNGDFLQGSPLADWSVTATCHPILAAMNHLRYDAVTLGNHEFNFGIEALERALERAEFPVVSANVSRMDGAPLVPRSTVLEREVTDGAGRVHRLRVGVIGFLPVQVMVWDRGHLAGRLKVEAAAAAARRLVATLRQTCDLVVALCHGGIGPASAPEDSEDAATALAGLPGIDVVIAGHSHLVFPSARFAGLEGVDAVRGTLQGKPAVMPGSRGSHLGVVDLRLRVGTWAVEGASSAAVPVGAAPPDPELSSVVRTAHTAVLAEIDRPMGRTEVPLNSFFALVAPARATAVIAEASARHLRAEMGGTLPVLGTGQPFKCGGRGGPEHYTDIPAGPLSLRHAADLYGYPNTIAALRLTGADIALWLERAAGAFRTICPGASDEPLLEPAFAAYNFDIVHGVEFEIDLARPAMFDPAGRQVSDGRIRNLRFGGAPLDPAAEFLVATSSYRAGGTGGFAPRPPIATDGARMRDVVARHLPDLASAAPERPFWRFAPMPETSVTFRTSPRALAHLDEVPHLSLTPLAQDEEGFLVIRLDL